MRLASRFLNVGRRVMLQVTVSVIAAAGVAAMFAAGRTPAPTPTVVADTGKSVRRVADGAVETRVLRLDAQHQAAMASFASFTPGVAPQVEPPQIEPPPVVKMAARPSVTVRPPLRPANLTIVAPASPEAPAPTVVAAPAKPDGWRVAGYEIPGSARVRKFVPTGDDVLRTGSAAWKTSADAVKKVASLTSLLGL